MNYLKNQIFLTIHYLLSDRSRNLVKYDDISKMKKTAF